MTTPRVLIVEDERPLADLLAQAFRDEGWQVGTAGDGLACMNQLVALDPDVVIMDVMMPRLDGIDTTRLLRRNPRHARTVVIVLTARADRQTREQALAAGADLVITKPFDIAHLLESVERLRRVRSEAGR